MSERKSERERERRRKREREGGKRESTVGERETKCRGKRGRTRMHPNMLYKSYSLPSFMNDQLQFSIEQRICLLPSTSSLYLNSDKNCSPAGASPSPIKLDILSNNGINSSFCFLSSFASYEIDIRIAIDNDQLTAAT